MSIEVSDISKVFWTAKQGATLKQWMELAERSLSQVARAAGISKTQVSKLVDGKVNDIDPRKAEAIARYLGQDPAGIVPYLRFELPPTESK